MSDRIRAASEWVDSHEIETGKQLPNSASHIKAFLDGITWGGKRTAEKAFVIHIEDAGTKDAVVSLKDIEAITGMSATDAEYAEQRAEANEDTAEIREWRPAPTGINDPCNGYIAAINTDKPKE